MAMKPLSLSKPVLSLFFLLLRKLAGRHHRGRMAAMTKPSPPPPPLPGLDRLHGRTLVVDVEAWILRPPVCAFPYFMLVAIEAGGFLRGLLLLLLYPLLCLLGDGARARAMATVALVGLEEKEVARVGRAVLPKFFLEAAAAEGVAAVQAAARVVAVSATFPRVMLDGFLREYVGVDAVVGPEVRSVGGVLAGLVDEEHAAEMAAKRLRALFGAELEEAGKKGAVGLVGAASSGRVHYLFSPYYCKETFAVGEADTRGWRPLPRDRYPRPLVFHDGRLAFAPTPPAALAMYTFLPFGIALVAFRSIALSFLPYRICFPVGALTGMHYRLVAGHVPCGAGGGGGRLYVCNHRTLLDPVFVAAALGKPVTAVTYSLSPVSELLAPIRTARLTRDREKDRRNMAAVLARGDLVVCPEGTTCREEYLLRLSPLFAELGVDVNPVALDTRVGMFYGTSTKPGAKWMDPFYFMMNPRPAYRVEFLPRAAASRGGRGDSIDVANRVQRELGRALGFELTGLTRKDKYMTLAGNEGVVPPAP
ncbi:hypothetical protein PAHAL_5G431600 [Panicum hallii]|uniref:Phospholipid/glycerol acyltransferase domain-containing protein n=1 Tax=Panicum hallii TaxID=206008 RepID=A0A2S3HWP4_9POAL|nr:probable glycerol-3-phosphate acyltransferase 3 [Panicum hallii]PAN31617.1 hypothetical protein PAHAL_5G431600 [Panicum hallii]